MYVIIVCYLFTHGAPRSSQELVQKCPCIPGSNWNLEMLGFEEGKTGVPGEKPLVAEKRTNNKLNPHMTTGPGIELGTHWWKASALTTAPSLLPKNMSMPGLEPRPLDPKCTNHEAPRLQQIYYKLSIKTATYFGAISAAHLLALGHSSP